MLSKVPVLENQAVQQFMFYNTDTQVHLVQTSHIVLKVVV